MEEGVGEREKMNLVILPHQLAAGGSEPATDAVGISLLLLDSLLSFFLSFFLSFSLSFFRFFFNGVARGNYFCSVAQSHGPHNKFV